MYKVHLPTDQPTEKAVDRRRSAETARKARIFNTRLRVMGIDVDALNRQAEDKKHQQSMEMQQNKAFGKLSQWKNYLSFRSNYSLGTQLGKQSLVKDIVLSNLHP